MKANNSFIQCVAMRTKLINTKTDSFYLSSCCIEHFNFTSRPCLLTIGPDQFFTATGLVLPSCDPTFLRVKIPMRIKTTQHGLTDQVVVYLASINNRFAPVG